MNYKPIQMIHCPACGKEISEQAIQCPSCGHPVRETLRIKHATEVMSNARKNVFKCTAENCFRCHISFEDPIGLHHQWSYFVFCANHVTKFISGFF